MTHVLFRISDVVGARNTLGKQTLFKIRFRCTYYTSHNSIILIKSTWLRKYLKSWLFTNKKITNVQLKDHIIGKSEPASSLWTVQNSSVREWRAETINRIHPEPRNFSYHRWCDIYNSLFVPTILAIRKSLSR